MKGEFGNDRETITFMLCHLLSHFQETNTCIFMVLKLIHILTKTKPKKHIHTHNLIMWKGLIFIHHIYKHDFKGKNMIRVFYIHIYHPWSNIPNVLKKKRKNRFIFFFIHIGYLAFYTWGCEINRLWISFVNISWLNEN